MPGTLGHHRDAPLLVLAGHDTNLLNLSGLLGLGWKSYQPDAPSGRRADLLINALIFSIFPLWRVPSGGGDFLRLRYIAQTLDQMRDKGPVTLAAPPPSHYQAARQRLRQSDAPGRWRARSFNGQSIPHLRRPANSVESLNPQIVADVPDAGGES